METESESLRPQRKQAEVLTRALGYIENLQSQITDLRNHAFAHDFVLSVIVMSMDREEYLKRLQAAKNIIEEDKTDLDPKFVEALRDVVVRLEKVVEGTSDQDAPS